jgi:hypothetical protein
MVADEGERGLIETQIEAWVRQHVAFPDKKLHGTAGCHKVVLKHVNIERKPQGDVGSFAVRLEEGAEDEGVDPLLHKIADAAQGDADNLNQGLQTYAIFAYYPGDQGYVPRKFFRVSPSDVEVQRDLAPSEPPTEKGLVSQTQRHLEAVLRTTSITQAQLFQTMQHELRRMAELNEKYAGQQIEFMVVVQDMIDNAHGRRLQERGEEAKLALQESALAKLEALVPVIINRIAGKQVIPEQDRSLMLMAALLEGMSESQQLAFYGNLSDAQRITLAEIFSEYEQRKKKYHGQKNQAPGLGAKTGLPPAKPKQDKPPGETPLLLPESEVVPVPFALSLRERMKMHAEDETSDPQLKKIEADAQVFSSRFRDMLGGTKKPTTGDKR